MRTSRFQLPRLAAIAAALALLALLIISTGGADRSATASARVVMRELRPTMLAAAHLHQTCQPDRPGARCSASELVESAPTEDLPLTVGRGCTANGAACVFVDEDSTSFEIVSRPLPRIGGIRVETRIANGSNRVEWQCVPLRVNAGDERLAKRACGDIPLA